jgi:hypothetical protein
MVSRNIVVPRTIKLLWPALFQLTIAVHWCYTIATIITHEYVIINRQAQRRHQDAKLVHNRRSMAEDRAS